MPLPCQNIFFFSFKKKGKQSNKERNHRINKSTLFDLFNQQKHPITQPLQFTIKAETPRL